MSTESLFEEFRVPYFCDFRRLTLVNFSRTSTQTQRSTSAHISVIRNKKKIKKKKTKNSQVSVNCSSFEESYSLHPGYISL